MSSTIGPIGAHTSASGGPWKALLEGKSIGAGTIQFFTRNQRQWKSTPLSEETVSLFHTTHKETGLTHLMSHASYLINLASPDPDNLAKSRHALRQEIIRCQRLGITYLNFHPGSMLYDTRSNCLGRIIQSIESCADLLQGSSLRLLVEATAGQGSNLGNRFEDLSYLVRGLHPHLPLGVCLDTCHIFAAGYDIRTPESWERTLDTFDKVVGLEHLYAFHLNDSIHELGSRKDRHAPLGQGAIGVKSFAFLMQSERTRHLPKYLETPGGPALWQEELALLKSFIL